MCLGANLFHSGEARVAPSRMLQVRYVFDASENL